VKAGMVSKNGSLIFFGAAPVYSFCISFYHLGSIRLLSIG